MMFLLSLFEPQYNITLVIPNINKKKQLDPSRQINTPSGEGVLANFFNSLLNKKTGSPGGSGSVAGSPASLGANVNAGGNTGGGPGSLSGTASPRSLVGALNGTPTSSFGNADALLVDKMAVRNDAAAELERLTRTAAAATSSVKRDIDFTQSDC